MLDPKALKRAAQMAKTTPESTNIGNRALFEVKCTKALWRNKRQKRPRAQQSCLRPRAANTLPGDLRVGPQNPERPLALPSQMPALGKPRTAHAPARHLAHSPGGKARAQDERCSTDAAAGRGSGGERLGLCCRPTVRPADGVLAVSEP